MKIARVILFGLTVLLTSAGGLYADITQTINGTVLSGIDNAGVFGVSGANLAGAAATITYTLNPALLASDGLYSFSAGFTEILFNGTVADGALTNTITVNGISFTLTQGIGGQEKFLTQKEGSGSLIESLLFNQGSGMGSSITVHSTTPYQIPTLLGNPQPFLDLVSANAIAIKVGIDRQGGQFQTDLVLDGTILRTPEPSSIGLVLIMLAGLLSLNIVRKRQSAPR